MTYTPYSEDEIRAFFDGQEQWAPAYQPDMPAYQESMGRMVATLKEAREFGWRMDSIRRNLLESEAEHAARAGRETDKVIALMKAARTDPEFHGVGLDREARRRVAFQRVEKIIKEMTDGS